MQCQEGCSSFPIELHKVKQITVANAAVTYASVDGLAAPCLSSEFLERSGICLGSSACSYFLTFETLSGCVTEVTSFAIVKDSPVDLLLPHQWFTRRSLDAGMLVYYIVCSSDCSAVSNILVSYPSETITALNRHVDHAIKNVVARLAIIHDCSIASRYSGGQ